MLCAVMLNVVGSTVVRPSYTCFVIIRLLKWSVGYLKLDEKKYLGRESSLKGKDKYNGPPCTNQFRSAAFYNKNITSHLQTSYLKVEVNCTELSPSVIFPWFGYQEEAIN